MANKIICPHCKKNVELSDAFKHEIEEKLKQQLEQKASLEIEDYKKALAEKEEKLDQMREDELILREEKRKLETSKKEMALDLARQLDSEKKKLEEQVLKQAYEEHRLNDLEKDKKISDLMGALEEAKRRAQVGSQQLQGEVLELDLEKLLSESFPNDAILPVGKGVVGADIKQIVKSPKGIHCGIILWEIKRTKTWSDGWISKLKQDLRSEKANIPVIVSVAIPKEAEHGMGLKDGVWVVKYALVQSLAQLLRKSLLDVGYEKAVSINRGKKSDILYEYVTGHEFRQQVESLAESYHEMQQQLEKERVAMQRQWKMREMQIRKMISSTASLYGAMQGLVGSSMPQVRGLEMMELTDGGEV